MGLPRSGSTVLSRLLNDCDDGFFINDFYFLQEVAASGSWDALDAKTRRRLLDFVVDQIHNRTRPSHVDDQVWSRICKMITGSPAAELGFGTVTHPKVRAGDVADLLCTTGRNATFYGSRVLVSTNVRRRVVKFANEIVRRNG